MRWLQASTLFIFALSLPASAGILWKGDFETGDLSQWSSIQAVSSDRLQIVDSPVREGTHSLRVAVRQGDDPINASGNRNELIFQDRFDDGARAFYRWSTFFPSSFPRANTWQIFSQFHHTGCCGSPPVEFYVRDDVMYLRVGGSSGKVVWKAPLERAIWKDFILQVRWSANASVGEVALWYQGEQVLAPIHVATRYPGEGSYFKLGYYRDASISTEGVLFHDNVAIATTLEDLLPAPAQPDPDEQTPGDGSGGPDDGAGQGEPGGGQGDGSDDGSGDGSGTPGDGQSPPTDDGRNDSEGPGAGVVPDPNLAVSCSSAPTGLPALGLLGAAAVLMRLRRRRAVHAVRAVR